jgi:hypothetical protein
MNSIIDQILQELEELKLKAKPSVQDFHIFYKLLNCMKDQLSFDQEAYLLWVFTKSERGLNEARKGNNNLAKYHLEQVLLENGLNPTANFAYDFVVYPAKAFYAYNNLYTYDDAIALLIKAIYSINSLSKIYPEMISAAIEQYLNLCRVLFKKNERITAVNEFGKLISFMLSGRSDTTLVPLGPQDTVTELEDHEKYSMIDFVTDVAIHKIYKSKEEADDLLVKLYESVKQSSHYADDAYSLSYLTCLRLIVTPASENQDELRDMVALLPVLFLLPNTLQYLFLKKMKPYFADDERVIKSIDDYLIVKLKMEDFLNENMGAINQSPLRK